MKVLKQITMLKLSLFVLLAVSLYTSTQGNNIELKDSDADSLDLFEEFKVYENCLTGSRVQNTLENCWAGIEDAARESTTEEECKNTLKQGNICNVNALDACSVHPRLRAAYSISFNRYIYNMDCLAEIAHFFQL